MKKDIKLTKRQREIITGLLLGDGHLETQNSGRTFRLKVEHSLNQEDYLFFLYKELKNLCSSEPKIKIRENGQKSIYFNTVSLGSLRFYAQQFYPERKKVIPKIIKKILTPLSLAIWYGDDGSRKSLKHKTYNIHSLGYTKSDLEKITKVIFEKFGVVTSLHRQKDKYWRIYIKSESAKYFKEEFLVKFLSNVHSLKNKIG